MPAPGRKHPLTGELIVSLTSYRKRFASLARTVRGLMAQDIAPDRIMLWIDPKDEPHLPAELLALRAEPIFRIGLHPDLGPATKLVPALKAFPGATIVTADDDFFYPSGWLRSLVQASIRHPGAIVCRRAHLARAGADGRLLPYRAWDRGTRATRAHDRSLIFPTGVGGVLYPPNSLAPAVLDETALLRLTPKADDVWFFWMGRLAGTPQLRLPGSIAMVTWPDTQDGGLHHDNVGGGGNDAQVRAMEEAYGLLAPAIKA